MTWILTLAGSKVGRIVALVLAVGLISFTTIRYIQSTEREKIELELRENELDTRESIDDAVRNSPTDPDAALEWLRGWLN